MPYSLRIGAVTVLLLTGLTAGCSGSMQSASQKISPSYETSSSGYPRPFRSKCDDLTDMSQRLNCYKIERETEENRQKAG